MSTYSTNWDLLHTVKYYKQEIYSLEKTELSQLELSGFIYAGSKNGGPIAFMVDFRKAVKKTSVILTNRIYVFSSSGSLLGEIDTKHCGKIIEIGWDKEDRLICVTLDSKIHIFSMFGDEIKEITVSKSLKITSSVYLCKIWGTGVAILNQAGDILVADLFKEKSPALYTTLSSDQEIYDMDIIPAQFSNSREPEVLLSTSDGELLICIDLEKQSLQAVGTVVKLSLSPSGKILAYFTQGGKLVVTTLTHDKILLQFETKSPCPTKLVWCGTDSILCYWEKKNLLLMIGPNDTFVRYSYGDSICLIPEIDGIRIISNDACEFLSRVPQVIQSIFEIGSDSPGSMLFEASQYFQQRDSRADKIIREISQELGEGINECLIAAIHEFDLKRQNLLIKAASLGKSYVRNFNHDYFAEKIKEIRILNQVRMYLIGIPITYNQFKKMGIDNVIIKLLNHRNHALAYEISKYLKLGSNKVLEKWACDKIKYSKSQSDEDEKIHDQIMEKLKETKSKVSFVEIAKVARDAGRESLAIKLIVHDPKSSNQVPLLLSMDKTEMALDEAISSGDNDLIYLILFHLLNEMSSSRITEKELFSKLQNREKAIQLLILYWKQNKDEKNLKKLLEALEKYDDIAVMHIEKNFKDHKKKNVEDKIKNFKNASMKFEQSKKMIYKQISDEQIKLINVQLDLEKKKKNAIELKGKSVNETISALIKNRDPKTANKVKKQFKVPDKRYWWITISTLAQNRMWENLSMFAESRNSPIGYEPFVRVCLKNLSKKEAKRYIPKMKNIEKKINLYMELGMWKQATEGASILKDEELLKKILQAKEISKKNKKLKKK
ncbi:vacuolar protein sorting vps16 [Anaeramoeba flamelloides]|uniref:Vacuolar protein sorting vps16 n=1 Tax=Anaeramoeba flamelloides TaxID=1746091 RepID=A0ABQ8Z5R2_9EUKA|nr:vacuolar protein sorting vps16 [Anaeramoeba flamelloides]